MHVRGLSFGARERVPERVDHENRPHSSSAAFFCSQVGGQPALPLEEGRASGQGRRRCHT
eukprot:2113606-Alexandrium_andersonii.AAC.1